MIADQGRPWLLAAAVALAPGLAAHGAPTTATPSHAQISALWEGGTWATSKFHGGGWMSGYKTLEQFTNPDFTPPNAAPLNAEAARKLREIRIAFGQGRDIFSPYAQCHPAGLPYILALDGYGGYQAVVGDREIAMMWGYGEFRRIYIDGRPHQGGDADSNPPTYDGDSVAHWEGKTMVIDTVNIRGENTQLEPHVPKGEGAHIVERYTPTSANTMDVVMTMTSPQFTRPWVVTFQLQRNPKGRLIEGLCTDGNRYGVAADGVLTMHGSDGKPLPKAED